MELENSSFVADQVADGAVVTKAELVDSAWVAGSVASPAVDAVVEFELLLRDFDVPAANVETAATAAEGVASLVAVAEALVAVAAFFVAAVPADVAASVVVAASFVVAVVEASLVVVAASLVAVVVVAASLVAVVVVAASLVAVAEILEPSFSEKMVAAAASLWIDSAAKVAAAAAALTVASLAAVVGERVDSAAADQRQNSVVLLALGYWCRVGTADSHGKTELASAAEFAAVEYSKTDFYWWHQELAASYWCQVPAVGSCLEAVASLAKEAVDWQNLAELEGS